MTGNALKHSLSRGLSIAVVTVALMLLPHQANADTWISGFVGALFGGSTGDSFREAIENTSEATYGFSVGGMGGGVFGAEFDLAYTPKFFGSDGAVATSRLTTAHGSLILGIPVGGQTGGGVRPYGVVGMGLISRRAEFGQTLSDISTNDFGYNLGVGVMAFFNDTVGVRGEYRYFRNFQRDAENLFPDVGTFSFSRATAGMVFRF